jgi:hypothetical protein
VPPGRLPLGTGRKNQGEASSVPAKDGLSSARNMLRFLGLGGAGGDKKAETPAGGAAGVSAEGNSEADDGLGGGGMGAGAGGDREAETPDGAPAGGAAEGKSEAHDGLGGGGIGAGAGGDKEAETAVGAPGGESLADEALALKAELISDAANLEETVAGDKAGNFFVRIVKACREEEPGMTIFKDALQRVRPAGDPMTILEGLLKCWKDASAEHKDSCDQLLLAWIRTV